MTARYHRGDVHSDAALRGFVPCDCPPLPMFVPEPISDDGFPASGGYPGLVPACRCGLPYGHLALTGQACAVPEAKADPTKARYRRRATGVWDLEKTDFHGPDYVAPPHVGYDVPPNEGDERMPSRWRQHMAVHTLASDQKWVAEQWYAGPRAKREPLVRPYDTGPLHGADALLRPSPHYGPAGGGPGWAGNTLPWAGDGYGIVTAGSTLHVREVPCRLRSCSNTFTRESTGGRPSEYCPEHRTVRARKEASRATLAEYVTKVPIGETSLVAEEESHD